MAWARGLGGWVCVKSVFVVSAGLFVLLAGPGICISLTMRERRVRKYKQQYWS